MNNRNETERVQTSGWNEMCENNEADQSGHHTVHDPKSLNYYKLDMNIYRNRANEANTNRIKTKGKITFDELGDREGERRKLTKDMEKKKKGRRTNS